MKNPNSPDDGAQKTIDALTGIDCESISFVQLRRLNAALLDASARVAAETARRSDEDSLGDTVRVAVPASPDR